jgi:hypothetical protein
MTSFKAISLIRNVETTRVAVVMDRYKVKQFAVSRVGHHTKCNRYPLSCFENETFEL